MPPIVESCLSLILLFSCIMPTSQLREVPMNVLFIISDQHRRNAAGCYGDPVVRTPHIDRLAQEGVRFTDAYCPSPLCGPSRSAIVTGTHASTCGVHNHSYMDSLPDLPTMGSVFRDAGYVTGAIGKLHAAGETDERDLGFDKRGLRIYTAARGSYRDEVGDDVLRQYAGYMLDGRPARHVYNPSNTPVGMDENLMLDNLVVDRCIEFMRAQRNKPFFLWAGLEKPHPEWYAPARFHDMYDPAKMPLPPTASPETIADLPESVVPGHMRRRKDPDEKKRGMVAAYYANVSYMDWNVGRLLDALDELELRGDTVVVYTSDHGENLFEHGLIQKHCLFESAMGVPLVISHRDLPVGSVCETPANLIDLFPTLAELAKIDPPSTLEGTSRVSAMQEGTAPEGDAVTSECCLWGDRQRMVRSGRWKYILAGNDEVLFDMEFDPWEERNLAKDPAHAERCGELKKLALDGWNPPPDGYLQEGMKPIWPR